MALLAALVTVFLWASAFVGIRAAGEDLSPGALSLGRLAIGSVLLGGLALSRGGRWPGRALYAGAVIAQKPLLSRASALHITWLACLNGTAVCLPFAPQLVDELGSAKASSIAWMAYLGAFPTAVAFTTWAYALSRTTAGRMGATTYLAPLIAILLGWVLLGESPEALAFLGGALCLVGVVIARRPALPRLRARGGDRLQSAHQGG